MDKPKIPDIFAVLFFNDLVRNGWSIKIEPSRTLSSWDEGRLVMGCVVQFDKDDSRFSGEGITLDQAINDARTGVERELEQIRAAIAKAYGAQP